MAVMRGGAWIAVFFATALVFSCALSTTECAAATTASDQLEDDRQATSGRPLTREGRLPRAVRLDFLTGRSQGHGQQSPNPPPPRAIVIIFRNSTESENNPSQFKRLTAEGELHGHRGNDTAIKHKAEGTNKDSHGCSIERNPRYIENGGQNYAPVEPEIVAEFLAAAVLGDLDKIRSLVVDMHVDTEVRSDLHWTPLNLAALAGHLRVVRFLLQEGADLEASDALGQTPLGSAAINGHTGVVRALLDWCPSANLSARDADGAQPIHYAAQFGFTFCVAALLESGADPNSQVTGNGWTPLHAAAAAGQTDTLRLLIASGGEPKRRDWQGRRPRDVIGTTLRVTTRKRRKIECLLDGPACGQQAAEEDPPPHPSSEQG